MVDPTLSRVWSSIVKKQNPQGTIIFPNNEAKGHEGHSNNLAMLLYLMYDVSLQDGPGQPSLQRHRLHAGVQASEEEYTAGLGIGEYSYLSITYLAVD